MAKKINSRQKGAAAEREVVSIFREFGLVARRGQQFSGGNDSPDVVVNEGDFPYHLEVKRVERFDLYGALDQAKRDSLGTDKEPLVIHRKNKREWVAVVDLRHFLSLITQDTDLGDELL